MIEQITETREYQKLLAELRANARVISVNGLVAGSARALAVAALQRDSGKTFAVVAQSTRDLEPWERDLRFWSAELRPVDGPGSGSQDRQPRRDRESRSGIAKRRRLFARSARG